MRDKGAQNQLMGETVTQRFTLTGTYNKNLLNQSEIKQQSYKQQSGVQVFYSSSDLDCSGPHKGKETIGGSALIL